MRRVLRRWPWMGAAALYLVVATALLAPGVRPGRTVVPADILSAVSPYRDAAGGFEPHNPLLSDAAFQFGPWMAFLAAELREDRVPQWNPGILGGVRVSPSGFVAPYYPPFWLLRWLDSFDAYNAFVVLHLALGALGLYAFARAVGARAGPATVAGLFAFVAGFWVGWSLHLVHLVGMVWIGFFLAAVHRAVERPRPLAVAAVAAVVGLWWLGANPQYAYLGALAGGAYALACVLQRWVHDRRPPIGAALAVAGGVALGALVAAPALLPTLAISDDVVRGREPQGAVTQTHFRPDDLAAVVVPRWRGSPVDDVTYRPYAHGGLLLETPYVGVVTAVLAAAGVAARRRWPALLLIGGLGLVFVLAFTGWPHGILHGLLPGYDRFRNSSRWLALAPTFAAPLAALGLTALLDREVGARRWCLGAVVAAAAVVVGFAVKVVLDGDAPQTFFAGQLATSLVALVAVAAGVVASSRWVGRRAAAGLVGAVLVGLAAEAVVHSGRWYPSIRERNAYAAVPVAAAADRLGGRLARLGPVHTPIPAFAPDIPLAYGLADAQGVAVLFPRDTDRFLRIIDDYGQFAVENNTAPPLVDPSDAASPLLDVLDVRALIVEGAVEPAGLDLVDPGPPRVYRRISLGPAAVVPSARAASDAEMWRSVADPQWDPRATAAVVGLGADVDGGPGQARLLARSSDRERFEVTAPQGGLLRVSGRYDPGWRATVDGRRVTVHRTDGLFRGVVVPAGTHTVELRFVNPDERRGRQLAVAGLLATAAVLAVGIRRVRR